MSRSTLNAEASSTLGIYLKEIGRVPRLTPERERDLGYRAMNGDEEAIDQLVEANLRLVVYFAKKQRSHLPLLDLIQEGNQGLLQAARGFDPSMGVTFAEYAKHWVKGNMNKANDAALTVHESLTQTEAIRKIKRERQRFKKQHNRDPSVNELAKLTGFTVERVKKAVKFRADLVSWDAPVVLGGAPLAELICLDEERDPAVEMDRGRIQKRVQNLMREIIGSEREARIYCMRKGYGSREYSAEEVGAREGVTRERVRQLSNRAEKKLRQPSPKQRELRTLLWELARR